MTLIMKLKDNIRKELFDKIDDIYNHRKRREGLHSAHNCLCNEIKNIITDWANKEE